MSMRDLLATARKEQAKLIQPGMLEYWRASTGHVTSDSGANSQNRAGQALWDWTSGDTMEDYFFDNQPTAIWSQVALHFAMVFVKGAGTSILEAKLAAQTAIRDHELF
jgi:hypothetical protein